MQKSKFSETKSLNPSESMNLEPLQRSFAENTVFPEPNYID